MLHVENIHLYHPLSFKVCKNQRLKIVNKKLTISNLTFPADEKKVKIDEEFFFDYFNSSSMELKKKMKTMKCEGIIKTLFLLMANNFARN